MAIIQSILIGKVVVSTNQGVVQAVPTKILKRQGYDYSHVPCRTYGSSLNDNRMITSLLQGETTFEFALLMGIDTRVRE